MNFATIEFLCFFTAVGTLYWSIPLERMRARKLFLLAASFAFYASWSAPFTLLLLYSIVLDYNIGLRVPASSGITRRLLLLTSLVGNLGILAFFKYGGFFYANALSLDLISQSNGVSAFFNQLVLPLGISFYTFQSLSYTIDVHRGQREPTTNFVDFALYVSFFPQLVAGPIMRAGELLPQLERAPSFRRDQFNAGFARFGFGLAKKVIFADSLALFADPVFADPTQHSPMSLALALYAYSFQIYFDFSGYTDMAIGLGRMLGYELVPNFNFPYLATSITDFWRRWHMTLSQWLRDYLYIPLGGSRRGRLTTYRNLFVTMLLGGLWHGAGWNFVLWGAFHGILLAVERAFGLREAATVGVRRTARIIFTYHLVVVGWFFFRISSPTIAEAFVTSLAEPWSAPTSDELWLAVFVAVSFALHTTDRNWGLRERFERWPSLAQGLAVGIIVILMLNLRGLHQAFIYFQF